ncbi:hypothetical protein PR202_ga03178 [Eleusine coracana subsp. coracana]|uniref:DUF676 domain-containing protein n=1 Tax=Eleusine coracana subsp. coracana TaxID=191504 RepID=A0AAV5BMR5_ELECO|nr:hypothetical protein PR202_ga03178 [Eleusine coracana subsp. coracana]
MWVSSQVGVPASSRFYPSATFSLASAPFPPRRRHRRRVASLMGQSQSAPSGRSRNRSSSSWPRPGLGLDLGFLHGRRPKPGGEKLNPADWLRSVLSPPLPPPTAEAESEAEAEGKAAGSREEEEVGGEEADHLVVMVNGLYGSSADWKFAAEQFVKKLPGKVFVHQNRCSALELFMLVRQVVQRKTNLRKISFVAHSLGGLVTRYAIGKLYEPSMGEVSSLDTDKLCDEQKIPDIGKIAGLEPINFITSATPHLGSRWNKQLPYLFGIPIMERLAAGTAHFIVGRTGKHLFLKDRDDGKPPLLLRMVEDCDDGKFMSALRSFKRRVAYANITYDQLMIRGLIQVSWERVDVCIHESRLRYNAHHNIQEIDPEMGKYSDGRDGEVGVSYPLVAVCIDKDKNSQNALKYATETLIHRGQTIVLVHVNTKGNSGEHPCHDLS